MNAGEFVGRLFGGHFDGNRIKVAHCILADGQLRLAIPQIALAELSDVDEEFGPAVDIEQYCWDGTVNEDGDYRFRWEGTFR